tara:strand:+ start:8722 stop:16302 length:7581 start_codon:yes stop_codon:yes gene_type:complete
MSNKCAITTHVDNKESKLYPVLMDIFKNEAKANRFFNSTDYTKNTLGSKTFKESFYEVIDGEIIIPTDDRVYTETGEPKIHKEITNLGYTEYYYLDKQLNKEYITPKRFDNISVKDRAVYVEAIKESVSYFIYDKYKKDNGSDIIAILNGVNIDNEIDSYIDSKASEMEEFSENFDESNPEDVKTLDFYDKLNDVLDHLENYKKDFKKDIVDKFNGFNINVKEIEIENEERQIASENQARDEKVTAIEVSPNLKMTASVKALISFLPAYNIDSVTGEVSPKLNPITGSPVFKKGDEVNNALRMLLSRVHSIPNEPNIAVAQIKLLKQNSKTNPHYNDIITLLEESDDKIRTQFAQAFNLTNNDIVTMEVGTESKVDSKGVKESKVVAKTIDTSKEASVQGGILKKWRQGSVSILGVKDEKGKYIKLDKEKLQLQSDILETVIQKLAKSFKPNIINDLDKFNKVIQNSLYLHDKSLFKILKSIGVTNLSTETLMNYIAPESFDAYNIEARIEVSNNITDLASKIKTIVDSAIKNSNLTKYNLIKDNESGLFDKLASLEMQTSPGVQEASAFVGGKSVFKFSNASYIQKEVDNMKRDKSVLENRETDIYTEESLFANHLLAKDIEDNAASEEVVNNTSNKRLNRFKVQRFGTVQAPGKSSESTDSKTITTTDAVIENVNSVMMGSLVNQDTGQLTHSYASSYPTLASADKSTIFKINIDHFINDNIKKIENTENGDKLIFSDKILDVFYNYFMSEYKRSVEDYNTLIIPYEKALEEGNTELIKKLGNKLTVDKHFKLDNKGGIQLYDNKNKLIGNAFSISFFKELDFKSYQNDDLSLYEANGAPSNTEFRIVNGKAEMFSKDNRNIIKDIINKSISNNIQFTVDQLKKNKLVVKEGDNYRLDAVDYKITKTYASEDNNYLNNNDVYNFAADYTINSMIANIEFTKLFTGDPAYYKNMVDFFKRIPETYSDGLHLILDKGQENYTMSVIENTIVPSTTLNDMYEKLLNTDYGNKTLLKEVLKPYQAVNVTDAQGYITLDRWKFLLKGLGTWSKDHDVVYDYLNSTDNSTPKPTGAQLKMSAQPLKGVYYSLKDARPVYVKYSQGVLSPRLVNGTPMQSFLDAMVDQGIDEAVTLDGVKVGSLKPTVISDYNNIEFNKQTLNNADWKLQMELPTKLLKDTLLGSQLQKNIYDGIDADAVYSTEDGTITGEELITRINDTISKLSNEGLESLKKTLGFTEDNHKLDADKFYNFLMDDFKKNPDQFSDNLKRAADKKVMMELISPLKEKGYSMLTSKFRKNTSNIYTNGGSFVQMSNNSISKSDISKSGITMLVEMDELKAPTIVENSNKEEGQPKYIIEPGQIFISHNKISNLIPGYEEMDIAELNKIIDKKVLRAIGYRIPNQSMASNDALQIVGILPEGHGDTVVAYSEITTKTGSDFDIDKMYIMMPELYAEYTSNTFKKARKYLRKLDDKFDTVGESSEFMETLIEDSGIDMSIKELSDLFKSNDEYEINDIYFNNIVTHLVTGNSKIAKDFNLETRDIKKISFSNPGTNNKKQLNNRLFEDYWSVLTHADNYNKIMRSIDNPFLEVHIKALNNGDTSDTNDNMMLINPIYQIQLKRMLMETKGGVGISANHSVDHNLSKNRVNYKFTQYKLGVGFQNESGETLLDNDKDGKTESQELTSDEIELTLKLINKYESDTSKHLKAKDIKSFKISDTITALMNSFVDAAKDPFINKGNYNNYTSDTAFLLTRAGVHPYYTNSLLNSKVLKDLVEFIKIKESKLLPYDDQYKGLNSFDAFVVSELENRGYNKDNALIMMNKFENKKINTLTYEELVQNDNSDDILDMNILYKFKEYQEKAIQLNKAISISRMDTNGVGKNHIELTVLSNKIIEVANMNGKKGMLTNHFNKYIQNGVLTSLGTQMKNNVFVLTDILNSNPEIFVSGSSTVMDYINTIASVTPTTNGKNILGRNINDKTLRFINNEMYTNMLSKFPLFNSNENKVEFINKVKADIAKYQSNERDDYKNSFLQELIPRNNSFGLQFGVMSITEKNNLANAFSDLYSYEPKLDENNNVIPGQVNTYKLALDIIKASFYMNGNNRSLIDFMEFIPTEFYIDKHVFQDKDGNKYRQSIQNFFKNQFKEIERSPYDYYENFYERMLQNNLDNSNLVTKVKKDDLRSFSNSIFKKQNVYNSKLNYLQTNAKGVKNYSVKVGEENKPIMYLNYNGRLAKLTHSYIKDGSTVYIYELLNKRGFEDKSSNLYLKEYSEDETMFEDNKSKFNPKLNHSLIVNTMINNKEGLKEYDSSIGGLLDHYENKDEDNNFDNLNDVRELIFNQDINNLSNNFVNSENSDTFVESNNMNVETVDRYSVADLKANPNKIYIFGDNVEGNGKGGQAIIRDQENAFGIVTKMKPRTSQEAYFYDSKLESNKIAIDMDIEAIKNDGRSVVFPKDGIGTGLAKLKLKAPETFNYLNNRLLEEFGFDNTNGEIINTIEDKFKFNNFKEGLIKQGFEEEEFNTLSLREREYFIENCL